MEKKEKLRKKKRRAYISIAKIAPRKYREYITQLINFGGDKKYTSEDWIGSANILSILGFFIFIIIPYIFFEGFKLPFLLYGIGFIIAVHFFVIILLNLKVEDRKQRIEEALPDLLQLTSANIRSGMNPFKALKHASKKEFGPLSEEVNYVIAKSQGVVNFSDVLLEMNKRVKSSLLERTLRLFSNTVKTGGNLSLLLEDVAEDIVETRTLKKELVTNTRAYTMFIMFLVIIGTPLLLSVSQIFLQNILELQPESPTEVLGGVGNIVSPIEITEGFLFSFSIYVLVITSILASVLIGVIKEGNVFYGFRYVLFVSLASVISFFILNFVVGGFFG